MLHLASASPRRRQILTALGLEYSWAGADIDETPRGGESPNALVRRLAASKALAARRHGQAAPLVLGADTVVTLDERILGKPASREEALAMLNLLSGRSHEVLTAIALLVADPACGATGDRELTALSITAVKFRKIDQHEARAYWDTGEPCDKAGAYAVQGKGGVFVESLHGSYSGVVGLPVFETAQLLRQAGVELMEAVGAGGD